MLTVDFGRFRVGSGNRVLDVGCGDGRHAFEAFKRGADVIALDLDPAPLKQVRDMFDALSVAGEAAPDAAAVAVHGDGARLPLPDHAVDRVVVSEVLEHVDDDAAFLAEAFRVLAPGGLLAVTVPRWWPERVCWALSDAYHEVEGGHVRIYRRNRLLTSLRRAGFVPTATHHAHALHAPYWWLRCLLPERHRLVELYHEFLCWDILTSPRPVRLAERALDPVMGKSLVCYARKPC